MRKCDNCGTEEQPIGRVLKWYYDFGRLGIQWRRKEHLCLHCIVGLHDAKDEGQNSSN